MSILSSLLFSAFLASCAAVLVVSPRTSAAPSQPELVLQIGNPFAFGQPSFATHAPLFACGVASGVQLWDTRTWELRRTIRFPLRDTASGKLFALSPDGRTLADITAQNALQIWDVRSGKLRQSVQGGDLSQVVFSADGKHILGTNYVKTRLWDARTGQEQFKMPSSTGIAVPSSGSLFFLDGVAGQSSGLWDARTGRCIRTLTSLVGPYPYSPAAFSHDGALLATVGENPTWKGPGLNDDGSAPSEAAYAHQLTILIWRVKTGKMLRMLPGPYSQRIGSDLRFTSDNRSLVRDDEGEIIVQDAQTGRTQLLLHNTGPLSYSLLPPDGKTALQAMADLSPSGNPLPPHGLTVVTLRTGAKQTFHTIFSLPCPVLDPLDWRVGQPLRPTPNDAAPSSKPSQGQVSPDATKIAFVPDNPQKIGGPPVETVEIREMHTGKLDHILSTGGYPDGQSVFSPDGKTLAVVVRTKQKHPSPTDWPELWSQIQFWDVATGHLLHTLETNIPLVGSLLFSPDSRFFALNRHADPTGPHDAPLQIYELATGKIVRTLPPRTQWERAAQFSADDARLATVGDDGLTRLWSLRDGHLIVTLAGLIPGSHAGPEWIAFTPAGDYVASANAERFLRWRVGNRLYPAARYSARFRRPDLVRQAFQTMKYRRPMRDTLTYQSGSMTTSPPVESSM